MSAPDIVMMGKSGSSWTPTLLAARYLQKLIIKNNPVGRFSSFSSFGSNQLTLLVLLSVCLIVELYLREYQK